MGPTPSVTSTKKPTFTEETGNNQGTNSLLDLALLDIVINSYLHFPLSWLIHSPCLAVFTVTIVDNFFSLLRSASNSLSLFNGLMALSPALHWFLLKFWILLAVKTLI